MWWGVLVASAGAVCSGVATVMMALAARAVPTPRPPSRRGDSGRLVPVRGATQRSSAP
jgi:hypothetical protein